MTDTVKAEGCLEAVLAGLTHGFKRPLSAVLLSADILENRELRSEDVRSIAADMVLAVREALVLSEDLTDLLRLETGRWVLVPGPIEVAPLLCDLVADPPHPGLALDSPADQPFTALADRTGLERLLRCLVAQVVTATAPDARIRIGLRSGPDRHELSVHTTAGVPIGDLATVFEPFAPVFGPPGLALALAGRLSESQGCALVATGGGAEGTTFVLSLPRGDRSAPAASGSAQPPRTGPPA